MARPIPAGLTEKQQTERASAARAKAMLARGRTLDEATSSNRVRATDIRRWFGPSWRRHGNSIDVIEDDETLEMLVWTVDGALDLPVAGSAERLDVYDHRRAVAHLMATGDASWLRLLEGRVVAGHVLETDPIEVEAMWLLGEFDFLQVNSGPW